MIDLTVDAPHDPQFTCECGDPECLGPIEIAGAIAQSLAAQLPQLQSPMLKLIKERNEARELVKRMLLATEGAPQAEYYEAMLQAHRAVQSWKGGAK